MKAWLKHNIPVVLLAATSVALIALVVITLGRLESVRQGVCGLRDERVESVARLEKQLDRARAYRDAHPDGLPGLDITRADLDASIKSQELNLRLQRGTIRRLSVVDC